MKWIVFTLGLVLAVGGLVAILQGYDIVQVERGWTMVISGASALGAGIVTIALGVLIARIEALTAAWTLGRETSPTNELASARGAMVPFSGPPAEVAGAAPLASARPAAPAVSALTEREESAVPDIAPQQEVSERDFSFRSFGGVPQTADETMAPEAESSRPSSSGAQKKVRPRATFAMPPLVPAKSFPAPGSWPSGPLAAPGEPVAPAYFSRDFVKPPQTAPDLAPVAPGTPDFVEEARAIQDFAAPASAPSDHANPPRAGSEHDWLEMALAGTEPDTTVERGAATETPKRAVPPHVSGAAEESAGPAVVGRYESNGASYALFADGSIEAVTASGIYRFASMAELKEFIEGGS